MKMKLTNLTNDLLSKPVPVVKNQLLMQQLEEARQEWLSAQNYYNNVTDADLVDYAAYLIQAAEKKYTYLLKRARHEGVQYSPFN